MANKSKGKNKGKSHSRSKGGTQAKKTQPQTQQKKISANNSSRAAVAASKIATNPLQPEQMSLEAYRHIQECLTDKKVDSLSKEDVTAIIQLAQHLRVFGLLSAVGYVRHAREGKIRDRIRPMWTPLLWRLVCGSDKIPPDEKQVRQTLMHATYTLSNEDPKGYMVKWHQALKLSNHWNFWARACQEEESANAQPTENSDTVA